MAQAILHTRPGTAWPGLTTTNRIHLKGKEMQNKITVTIEGLSPLLMNRFPTESIHQTVRPTPEEQAERAAYRDPVSGELYLPAIALRQAMIEGAALLDVKSLVNAKSIRHLQDTVAGMLMIEPERLLLGIKDFVLDSRRVVRSHKAGALIRHRPRLDHWQAKFAIRCDGIAPDLLKDIVDNAGSLVGVLDFRPARKGPFGRFQVVEWRTEG